ncbi:MAG: 3-hydroxyacyl-CoA dehydrogenase [Gammaproteobacteria bacterium]|nr:3-hydroxyacyl-CoA dehydrogenase [Gammaproteobacteria bacterium]
MSAFDASHVVGVAGAGTMGAGIAQVAAAAGHRVKLHDRDAAAIDRGLKAIRAALDRRVERGRLDARASEQQLARIEPCPALAQLSDCALVIEAVAEDVQVKRALLAQAEKACAAETVLATNTSSLSVTEIGAALARPHNLVGMHFFNPAPAMKLVEVVSGAATAAQVAQRAFDTAAAWGKTPVFARASPGFIVNRVTRALYAEPLRLLQEGAAGIATLDALFKESAGFPLGPFELMDVIGNDVNYAVTESMFDAYYRDSRFQPSLLQKELVAGGLLGRKSGRGWYDYASAPAAPQPETAHSDFRPRAVTVRGDLGVAEGLAALAEQSGVEVARRHRESGEAGIYIDDTCLALTDGRSATLRASQDRRPDLVLFDLMADYAAGRRIALAGARQAGARALQHAVGFFNALGKSVSVLDDAPGLCVMRTVCMLANEGADAVYHGVCDAAAVDRAMRHGMNYPRGPLRWADQIGLARVQSVLRNLQRGYGLERYRCSQLIERKAAAGETFRKQPAANDHE